MSWGFIAEEARNLAPALLVTIKLCVLCIGLGTAIGLAVALGRRSSFGIAARISEAYSWFFRSLPALLTLFYIYYALPQLGVVLESFTAATIGLSLVAGAYFSEIIRGGFAAIGRGQYEAAKSLGMHQSRITRRIILPQVARVIVSPYISQCVLVVKSSALAGLIAVNELTGTAYERMAYTFRPLEILVLVWLIYLLLNSVLVSVEHVARWRFTVAPTSRRAVR